MDAVEHMVEFVEYCRGNILLRGSVVESLVLATGLQGCPSLQDQFPSPKGLIGCKTVRLSLN